MFIRYSVKVNSFYFLSLTCLHCYCLCGLDNMTLSNRISKTSKQNLQWKEKKKKDCVNVDSCVRVCVSLNNTQLTTNKPLFKRFQSFSFFIYFIDSAYQIWPKHWWMFTEYHEDPKRLFIYLHFLENIIICAFFCINNKNKTFNKQISYRKLALYSSLSFG